MNTNTEILNFLYLTSPRIGKSYQSSGINPLPESLSLTKDSIKERLYLGQMHLSRFPDFIFSSKNQLKYLFQNSIKNIKKILKIELKSNFSPIFCKKLNIYLTLREKVTNLILKEFKKFNFDECDAYTEIFELDPVMFEVIGNLFDEKYSLESIKDLESRYNDLYQAKLKHIEEKTNNKISKNAEILSKKVLENTKVAKEQKQKISKKDAKKVEKDLEKAEQTIGPVLCEIKSKSKQANNKEK
jgi:hypothetical protein